MGGAKPDGVALAQGAPRYSGVDPDLQSLSKSDSFKGDGPNNNDATPLVDDSFQNDQVIIINMFARYLCQQLVKDLPEHFLGADSSEEEDDRWIGGLDEEAVEMDIGEAILGETVNSAIPDNEELPSDESENLSGDQLGEEKVRPNLATLNPGTPMASPQNSWVDFAKMRLD